MIKKYLKNLDVLLLPTTAHTYFPELTRTSRIVITPFCGIIDEKFWEDLSHSSQVSDNEEAGFIFASPRLDCSKGLLDLVVSWGLHGLPYQLHVFAKDGELTNAQVRKISKEYRSDKSIVLGEVLPRKEYLRKIASSRGVLLPSYVDSCPLTLMESILLGKPTIFYDFPPVRSSVFRLLNFLKDKADKNVSLDHIVRSIPLGDYDLLSHAVNSVTRFHSDHLPVDLETIKEINLAYLESVALAVRSGLE